MSKVPKSDMTAMADALKQARSVVIFGLCGVSMEDQHRAFSLARSLGAYVSVERPLLPALTRGSLKRHALFLLAGGEPDFALPESAEVLRDDRLLKADAWRSLRILQRGRTADGAEAYRELHEKIVAASGAAFLPVADRIGDALRREVLAFRGECELPLGLDILQVSGKTNLQGAYETALEEAGGAHASFSGGKEKADDAFSLPELLRQGAVDAALLIGEDVSDARRVLNAGVPLYTVGAAVAGAVICVSTARLGEPDGGTILREDGMPVSVGATQASGLPGMRDALDALLAEVNA